MGSPAPPLCAVLAALDESPELCDVEFLVGPRSESVCGVRAILGARSPVFRAMLFDGWREQRTVNAHEQQQMRMPNNSPKAFRTVLQWAQAGATAFEPDTVMEVLELADFLALEELKASCEESIAGLVGQDNALLVLQCANLFAAP